MKHLKIKLSLFINYFVFAILLNSVGTVILQVQNNYGVTASSAAILEGFKDLSIAIVSFFVAAHILKIGYKRAMLISLGFISLVCLAMPQVPTFWMTKLMFAAVGVSFAFIKVSVFATIGLVTEDEKEHVSFMNFIESFFMIGVLSGYFIFSYFVDDSNLKSTSWLNAYYLLAVLSAVAFILLANTKLDESKAHKDNSHNLNKGFLSTLKYIFLILFFAVILFLVIENVIELFKSISIIWKIVSIGGILGLLIILVLWSDGFRNKELEEPNWKKTIKDFAEMLKLAIKPLVLIFIISAFLYVLIEQGIMSWLPSFNSQVLQLPTSLSIEMASILAASIALGRFLGGFILKKFDWFKILAISLIIAGILVLIVMPLAENVDASDVTSWFNAPLAAFVFPMIGLCLAPIYPAINSVILSALPVHQHAPMSGLIVVFSALGGFTGSLITGYMFEHLDGQTAFTMSVIPIGIILVVLYFFKRQTLKIAKA